MGSADSTFDCVMSGALQTPNADTAHSESVALQAAAITSRYVRTAVETVSFWAAVVLPLAYLPLVSGGLAASELLPFVVLLTANLLALTLGHDHNR